MEWVETHVGRFWNACLKAAPMRTWAMVLAAPPLTGLLAWIIYIVAYNKWMISPLIESLRLNIVANIAYGLLFLIGLVVVALTGVSFAAQLSKTGVNLNVADDGDHNPPAATVTTTTEVKV